MPPSGVTRHLSCYQIASVPICPIRYHTPTHPPNNPSMKPSTHQTLFESWIEEIINYLANILSIDFREAQQLLFYYKAFVQTFYTYYTHHPVQVASEIIDIDSEL